MPLIESQRVALAELRASLEKTSPFQFGVAESVDQRARQPDPAHLPADVTVRVEIAPPSPQPHPLLNTSALKTAERVPLYFYALQDAKPDADVAETRVVFFVHGGGNVSGHPTNQSSIYFVSKILQAAAAHSGDASKVIVIAPSYRLGTVPENTYPAALQDVSAAYEYVIHKGYKASNIFLAGDSTGGNHVIVLTHLILQSNQSAPGGVIGIAPDVVHVLDKPRERAKAQDNACILSVPMLEVVWGAYVGTSGVAWTDPLVSGAFLSFTPSWPKTLILVGSADLINDASHELEKRLAAANVAVELVEYDERPHGWWSLAHIFSEDITDAARRIARFVLEAP